MSKNKEKIERLEMRLSKSNKDKIKNLAERCNLTVSEYVVQRALGYEPRAVPPDALFSFIEKMDTLIEKDISPEVNEAAICLLKDICKQILLPGKEVMKSWQPSDSGLSETT